mgnify:CR=1 FL=1
MKIKKYTDFLLEKKENKDNKIHDYGCAMLYFNVKNWADIISFIDPEDVHEGEGLEDEPHLTLLYGFHKDEVTFDDISKHFKGIEEIDVEIESVGIFENEKYDVVKFNVKKTEDIMDFNEKLSKLPHTTNFPDYHPHITIGYVKPGTGKKYIKDDYKATLKSKLLMYSADEKETMKLK